MIPRKKKYTIHQNVVNVQFMRKMININFYWKHPLTSIKHDCTLDVNISLHKIHTQQQHPAQLFCVVYCCVMLCTPKGKAGELTCDFPACFFISGTSSNILRNVSSSAFRTYGASGQYSASQRRPMTAFSVKFL
jgi:hypothetical protein